MNNIIQYLVESVQQQFEIVFEKHLTDDEILALTKIAETYEVSASVYPPYTTLSAISDILKEFLTSMGIGYTEYKNLASKKFKIPNW